MLDNLGMTYRRRYFSRPDWQGVVELLFFDRSKPRSVGFQLAVLRRESEHFPGDKTFGLFLRIIAEVKALDARLANPAKPDAAVLKKLANQLAALSDLLTQHYFSHSVRRVY